MRLLLLTLLLCLIAWAINLPPDSLSQGFMFWRAQGIQLTGLMATALMSGLVVMAARPRWLEQRLGGLDHLYHLHKWWGITAGILVLGHWALAKSPHWLVDWGMLTLGPRPPHEPDTWRSLATALGEYSFYGLILLLVISLAKALPYGRFRQVHKLGAVLYLLAAIHSLYLLSENSRWTLFGLLALISCGLGLMATLNSLLGRIGHRQRYQGQLQAVRQHADNVLELAIKLPARFHTRYHAGQFALLTLEQREGAHPFTIVRADRDTGVLIFAIKALGDYTGQLSQRLKVGMTVTVEGPYGRFTLPAPSPRQYWIAGGIGVTPFLAWLEELAMTGLSRPDTRLYYCVNDRQHILFPERLRQLVQLTGVQLTIVDRQTDGLLDPSQLQIDRTTECWLCGPKGMRDLWRRHLPANRLHYEHFEFR